MMVSAGRPLYGCVGRRRGCSFKQLRKVCGCSKVHIIHTYHMNST